MHATGQMRRTDEDTLRVQMSKKKKKQNRKNHKHLIPVSENTHKERQEQSVLPSQRCQRCVDTDCSAEKVECRRGRCRENTEYVPGFSALIGASTTRGATQCQRSIMTRGSQPVCSAAAARCSVTNTNNRFQVTFYYPN